MGKPCTTNGGQWPEHKSNHQNGERVNYVSDDGLFEVVTTAGKKFPAHGYQVVVLRLRPRTGTRIVKHGDGLEALLTHREVGGLLAALNAADGKAQYRWREISEKPTYRKAYWQRINAARHRANPS